MKFMLITNQPDIAKHAELCGVDRIMVDMEVLGKEERQGHLNTHRAEHTTEDVRNISSCLRTAELMVRVNPLHRGTQTEVDAALDAGADRVMLPMFRYTHEVANFAAVVRGRVPITLLAETPASLTSLPAWSALLESGDQVHFGLNDLSLAMGLKFLFEPMVARLLDHSAAILTNRGIEFGVGGVAGIGRGILRAECILGEHVRIGSSWVILSRALHGQAASLKELMTQLDLRQEVDLLRSVTSHWATTSQEELEQNHADLVAAVLSITGQTLGAPRA